MVVKMKNKDLERKDENKDLEEKDEKGGTEKRIFALPRPPHLHTPGINYSQRRGPGVK